MTAFYWVAGSLSAIVIVCNFIAWWIEHLELKINARIKQAGREYDVERDN